MNGNTDNNVFEQYAELVKRVKAGDESAFTEIYEKSQKLVYTTCLGILNNEQDAEDAMQETYITVYDKISTLEDEKTFVHWLKTVAANKARDKFKLKKDNLSYEDAVATEEDLMGDDNLENLPDSLVLEKDKRDTLHKIMRNELSDAQYQTLLLYYYDELKISEIANVMECPEETIKSRLKASRIKLKAGIEAFEKKNGISLMGGVAGAQTLGNFFKSFYGSAKGPSIKTFPVKLATGPNPSLVASKAAAKTGAKAGGKAVAHSAAKTAGGASVTKIAGIATASVLGLGLIGGAALSIKKMIDENKLDDGTVYELNYKGLYCNIDEDDNVNECYRFYSNGDVIYASYEFDDDDECFPVGDWFNQGSDDDRVETGTFEADEGKLEVTLEHKSKDIERSGTIGKKSIVLDDVEYEFYKFSDIPGYITEFTPDETEPSGTDKTDPTVKGNRVVTVTDGYYKDEIYEYYPYGPTFTDEDEIERYPFHTIIPQVNISDIDMTAVNETIMDTVNDHYHIDDSWRGWNNVEREDLAETDYMYYIGEDVVSVVVKYHYLFRDEKDYSGDQWDSYSVFNISIETGELLESKDFIKMYGLADDEFFDIADACFLALSKRWDEEARDVYEYDHYNKLTYDELHPFISPEGHLCFEVRLTIGVGGTDILWRHSLIDTVTQDLYIYHAIPGSDASNGVDTIVSVTDAVNETYTATDPTTGSSYTYHFVIPKVTISGKDMDAVNESIYKSVNSISRFTNQMRSPETSYIYTIDNGILSIILKSEHHENPFQVQYRIYNISIESGKLITPAELLALRGMNEEEFFDVVEGFYKEAADQAAKSDKAIEYYGSYEDAYENYYNNNCQYNLNLDAVRPFIAKNGNLCFACCVFTAEGAMVGSEPRLYDVTNNCEISWEDL